MTVNPGKRHAVATSKIETIRSDEDLIEATRELSALMSSKTALSGAEQQRFQHLVNIIEEYEDAHYPVAEPSHAALLEHLLAGKGGGLTKLAKATRVSVSDIKAIQGGKRQIRPREAKALAKYFSVDPSIFESGPGTFVVTGVVTGSRSVGLQESAWFRVTGRTTANSINQAIDPRTFFRPFEHRISRQAGSSVPLHPVGLIF